MTTEIKTRFLFSEPIRKQSVSLREDDRQLQWRNVQPEETRPTETLSVNSKSVLFSLLTGRKEGEQKGNLSLDWRVEETRHESRWCQLGTNKESAVYDFINTNEPHLQRVGPSILVSATTGQARSRWPSVADGGVGSVLGQHLLLGIFLCIHSSDMWYNSPVLSCYSCNTHMILVLDSHGRITQARCSQREHLWS